MKPEEKAVLKLLDARINRSLEGALSQSLVALDDKKKNGTGKGKGTGKAQGGGKTSAEPARATA